MTGNNYEMKIHSNNEVNSSNEANHENKKII